LIATLMMATCWLSPIYPESSYLLDATNRNP
jgi:hypothetical protein